MLFRSSNQRSRGFSLIETIIFTAIASITVAVAGQIFISGLNTQSLINAEQTLITNARFIETSIFSRLTNSNTILQPTSGSASVLEFESVNSAENPVFFSITGDDLFMTLAGSEVVQLNTNDVSVTEFSVTRLSGSPATVQIDFTLEMGTTSGATPTLEKSHTFTLRYE